MGAKVLLFVFIGQSIMVRLSALAVVVPVRYGAWAWRWKPAMLEDVLWMLDPASLFRRFAEEFPQRLDLGILAG
jgi:hypothetical protein